MSELQLFCLPYSGASAMIYNRWRARAPTWLKVHPVELPGRGIRLGEPLARDMGALVRMLARQIDEQLKPPYAVFGHSLGGLLGFEVVHALHALGCASPLALCASGTSAPTRREDRERGYDQPKTDTELMAELRKFQGTPEDVLANEELMSLALPVLRADFLLCGSYQYRLRRHLSCPVHVLAGKTDEVSVEQLTSWADETSGKFTLDMFEGGHFFIHEQEAAVLRTLAQHFATDLQPRAVDATSEAHGTVLSS